MSTYQKMTEIEKLRHLANISGDVTEAIWDDLTRQQILNVCDAWMASGWDFYPDEWTGAQFTDAMRYGIAPTWTNDERPITYEAHPDDIRALRLAAEDFDDDENAPRLR